MGMRERQCRDIRRIEQNVIVAMGQCLITASKRVNENFQEGHRGGDNVELAFRKANKERAKSLNVVRVALDEVDQGCGIQADGLAVKIIHPSHESRSWRIYSSGSI